MVPRPLEGYSLTVMPVHICQACKAAGQILSEDALSLLLMSEKIANTRKVASEMLLDAAHSVLHESLS